jgi:hypothetical protein
VRYPFTGSELAKNVFLAGKEFLNAVKKLNTKGPVKWIRFVWYHRVEPWEIYRDKGTH